MFGAMRVDGQFRALYTQFSSSQWNRSFAFLAGLAGIATLAFPSADLAFSGSDDGFYSQLRAVGDSSVGPYILYPVHLLRLVAVYPAWIAHKLDLPAYVWSGLLFVYAIPLFSMNIGRLQKVACLLILVMAYFSSFRTCLVSLSIAILYFSVFNENKSRWLLIYSALLANLSSGVVISWIVIVVIYRHRFRSHDRFLLAIVSVLSLGLALSMVDKVGYLLNQAEVKVGGAPEVSEVAPAKATKGAEASEKVPAEVTKDAGASEEAPAKVTKDAEASGKAPAKVTKDAVVSEATAFVEILISRSTLVVTYLDGHFLRFAIYVAVLLYMVACLIYSLTMKRSEAAFFLVGLAGFLLEGLGPMSFFLSALLFGAGELGRLAYPVEPEGLVKGETSSA